MRKFVTILVLASVLANPAYALDVDSAFKSLLGGSTASVNKGGVYANSARTNFVVGGVDMRMPRKRITLLSITPPSIKSGCNGISAHFGGFSFVSGEQIEALINNIAANATGMVITLVLKTLCPICEGAIAAMTKMAQDAARLSIDSCKMADNILSGVGLSGASGTATGAVAGSVCGKEVSSGGEYKEYLDAMTRACDTFSKSVGQLEKLASKSAETGPDGKPKANANEQKLPIGNVTWNLLKAAGYKSNDEHTVAMRTLMLNLIGGVVIKSDANGKPVGEPMTIARTIDADRAMDLFMCGTRPSFDNISGMGRSRVAIAVCMGNAEHLKEGSAGGDGDQMVSCEKDLDKCLDPVRKSASDIAVFSEIGFLFRVSELLHEAVDDIRMNRELSDPELLSLLETVPFPVYQVLNTAAIYPVAAHDLVDTMSAVIADAMTTAMFEDVVRQSARSAGDTYMEHADLQNIQIAAEKFLTSIAARKTLMAQRVALQEGMMENIRTINLAIQKEVLGDEMLGTSRFSSTLNSATADPSVGQ